MINYVHGFYDLKHDKMVPHVQVHTLRIMAMGHVPPFVSMDAHVWHRLTTSTMWGMAAPTVQKHICEPIQLHVYIDMHACPLHVSLYAYGICMRIHYEYPIITVGIPFFA